MDAPKDFLKQSLIYKMHAVYFVGSKLLLSHSYGLPNTKWNEQKFNFVCLRIKFTPLPARYYSCHSRKKPVTLGQCHLCQIYHQVRLVYTFHMLHTEQYRLEEKACLSVPWFLVEDTFSSSWVGMELWKLSDTCLASDLRDLVEGHDI